MMITITQLSLENRVTFQSDLIRLNYVLLILITYHLFHSLQISPYYPRYYLILTTPSTSRKAMRPTHTTATMATKFPVKGREH